MLKQHLRTLRRKVIQGVSVGVSVVALVEVTTHLPSEGRSSQVYHDTCDFVTQKLIPRILSEEQAHTLAVQAIQYGWAPKYRRSTSSSTSSWVVDTKVPFTPTLTFPSPIGAAAGLDKDGKAIRGLLDMGFGFVEIGTVTPLPQPGNPSPRIFRLPEDRAILNRCGFNSLGIEAVQQNLQSFRNPPPPPPTLVASTLTQIKSVFPKFVLDFVGVLWKDDIHQQNIRVLHGTSTGIVGLNIGKNKEAQDEIEDYRKVIRSLGNYVDYIVINISSPNTPGLRDTFQRKEKLQELLLSCIKERDALLSTNTNTNKYLPLMVKISPDLSQEEMKEIAQLLLTINNDLNKNETNNTSGIGGLVISNTTTSQALLSSPLPSSIGRGGISGRPLFQRSVECIRTMYELTDGNIPIIGVGGVSSGHDAYEMIRAGASVIELYTVLTYEGPGVVSQIRNELIHLLYSDGHKSVQDAVGYDHEAIYWRKKKEQLLVL